MSIIKALLESENAIKDNIEISKVVNELSVIQESAEILSEKIVYTAEAVPVFATLHGENKLYVIECDNLFKLMDSQNCDEIEALKGIKSVLALDDPEVQFDDMALLVKDENIEQIEELCKKDKSKIGVRTEQVMNYTNMLKNVLSEGVKLLVDKK